MINHLKSCLLVNAFLLIGGGVFMLSSGLLIEAEKWERWEKTLTSSKTYSNPFLDHDLKVTYTSPTGKTYSSYGFWDGGTAFRIRFMFNEIGSWNWKTTFSDTDNSGLHNRLHNRKWER